MLTVSRSDEDLFAALRAGASGYLLKDMPFEALGDELADVLDGRVALPPELVPASSRSSATAPAST